ncbi:TetR family transcriptional regulator [Streptomyces antimycoticus]|uniref:TetR family transcriptional regulator n=1 Tax=Streptomyces antimycoticus TaxID=68175 RepID=A0A499UNQ4_9ACTN|nr:TetR family transcriptional regulator [Streptomyces antimycoticus]
MTTGGFYKQFASKEALSAEATGRAFEDLGTLLAEYEERHRDHAAARHALIEFYLSTEHRDQPGTGCPAAGLAGDMARDAGAGEAGRCYANGLAEFTRWLSENEQDESDGLAAMATLVGAILLSRATTGTEFSEAILKAARDTLTPREDSGSRG